MAGEMPRTKEHKARTRERIVRSAGRVFRRVGYEAATIDGVMAEAELTRGGFYAHFASKDALFATVVETDHGLIRMLAARAASAPAQFRARTRALLRDYLDPDHLEEISRDCSFAALTADARRGSRAVRAAYGRAFETLVAELLRGPGETAVHARRRATRRERANAAQIAAVATGTLVIAAALGPGEASSAALESAWEAVRARLED